MKQPAVSSRTDIPPFVVMDVMAKAAVEAAKGRSIIHMEVGEPGYAAPEAVRSSAMEALGGAPLPYTLALGRADLRQAVSDWYRDYYKLPITAERIIITAGSSAGFVLAFQAAFEAGDKMGTINPYYPAYRNTAASLGVQTVMKDVGTDSGWQPQPEDIEALYYEEGIKGFLFASPANPTGSMAEPERIKPLVEMAQSLGLWFISDEIYHGLSYDVSEISALAYSDDVIVINSFSKYFCMTGWRLGWMVVPERLVRPIERLAQNFFICPSHLSQKAGLAAFACRKELDSIRDSYQRNRLRLLKAFDRLGLTDRAPADGAFYLYVNIRDFAENSMVFTNDLLDKTGITATPGYDFDSKRGQDYVRFSYAESEEAIEEAIRRLSDYLAK